MNVDELDLDQKMSTAGFDPKRVKADLVQAVENDLLNGSPTDLLTICKASGLSRQKGTELFQLVYDMVKLPSEIETKPEPNLITGQLDELNVGERDFEVVSNGFRLHLNPEYTFRYVQVTDTHLGSRHDNVPGLEEMADRAGRINAIAITHSGDVVDGSFRRHRDMFRYLRPGCMGSRGQLKYVVDNWPVAKTPAGVVIPTIFIAGNHDHFAQDSEDVDICELIDVMRKDMHYIKSTTIKEAMGRKFDTGVLVSDVLDAKDLGSGRVGAVKLGPAHLPPEKRNTIHMMIHPGDGSAMALSYKPQRMVVNIDFILDSFEGMTNPQGRRIKPHSLQIGHYHKAHADFLRGIYVYQAGTMKFGDEFHEVKNLNNQMGYWVVENTVKKNGDIVRCESHFMRPYVGRKYHPRTVVTMPA